MHVPHITTYQARGSRDYSMPAINLSSPSCVASRAGTSPTRRPARSTRMRVERLEQLGQLARDDEHGRALARELADQRVDLRLRADVDAARRLVEDQHRRTAPRATAPARSSAGCRPRARRRACRCSGVRTRSRSKCSLTMLALLAPDRSHVEARQPAEQRQRRVAPAALRQHQPLSLAVLRHEADAEAIASAGVAIAHRAAAHEDPPLRSRDRARRASAPPPIGRRRPAPRAQPPRPRARERDVSNLLGESPARSTRSTSSLDAVSRCCGKYSASGRPIISCTSSRSASLGDRRASRRAGRRAAR